MGPSTFTCDDTIRNAKFETGLQALAVPVSDEEEPMFNLLDGQNFVLQIDFINTNFSCMQFSIYQVIDTSTTSLNPLACSNNNGTLSVKVPLPQHAITIKAVLSDIQLVGGLRVGLSGPGQENGLYSLLDLNFIQAFYSSSGQTVAQTVTINMEITKVCQRSISVWKLRKHPSRLFFSANRSSMKQNHYLVAILISEVSGIPHSLIV